MQDVFTLKREVELRLNIDLYPNYFKYDLRGIFHPYYYDYIPKQMQCRGKCLQSCIRLLSQVTITVSDIINNYQHEQKTFL